MSGRHPGRRVIDIHTHVFPDAVAARAMPDLQRHSGVTPAFDGTLTGLVAAMDRAGVEKACIQPVATRPDAVAGINDWAAGSASARIAPFGAMHPALADPAAEIARLAALGLHGFKLHPEFQAFWPDDELLRPIYEAAIAHDLTVFCHAGLDIALPTKHSDPAAFARVNDDYPRLRLVLAHMGGWKQWEEVAAHLVGRDLFLETSFTLPYTGPQAFVDLVRGHSSRRVVFGSDGPWADAGAAIAEVIATGLGDDELDDLLWRNSEGILAAGPAGPGRASPTS